MLARLARYEVNPERCNEAVEAFQEVTPEIVEMQGFQSGYILVDAETGAVATITFWENQAAADASETRAAGLRRRAIGSVEGDVQSVQGFNVVREFGS